MTDKSIDLDQHRGSAGQKASDLCRLLAEVEANERALHLRQDELEFASGRGAGGELARSCREGALSSYSLCHYASRARPPATEADCGRAQ